MSEKREREIPKQSEVQPSKGEIRERVAYESTRRMRLGVPAFAGGFLYLLGSITVSATLKGLPTVGLVQGIAPALQGTVDPPVSPRAGEVRYYDHHAFGLIAGATLAAIAIGLLMVVLLFLFDATRFRRPAAAPVIRPLVLVGGIGLPVLTVIGEIVQAIGAHNFVTGHDFTTKAVENALTKNIAYEVLGYITPLAAITLVAGMITLMVSSVRAGLQPRWMGIVGGVGAAVLLVPSQELSVITAFWMVGTALLLMGRWPGGDPAAWAAGEARPWPSQLELRAEREARRGGARAKDTAKQGAGSTKGAGSSKGAGSTKDAGSKGGSAKGGGSSTQGGSSIKDGGSKGGSSTQGGDSGNVAPEPVQPAPSGGGRRRRKRGSRR